MEGTCRGSNRGRDWCGRRQLPYSTVPSSTSEQNATGLSRCLNRIACRLSSEAELRRISPIRGSFGDVFLIVLQLYLLGKVGVSLQLLGSLFLVYSLNYILSTKLYTPEVSTVQRFWIPNDSRESWEVIQCKIGWQARFQIEEHSHRDSQSGWWFSGRLLSHPSGWSLWR